MEEPNLFLFDSLPLSKTRTFPYPIIQIEAILWDVEGTLSGSFSKHIGSFVACS